MYLKRSHLMCRTRKAMRIQQHVIRFYNSMRFIVISDGCKFRIYEIVNAHLGSCGKTHFTRKYNTSYVLATLYV